MHSVLFTEKYIRWRDNKRRGVKLHVWCITNKNRRKKKGSVYSETCNDAVLGSVFGKSCKGLCDAQWSVLLRLIFFLFSASASCSGFHLLVNFVFTTSLLEDCQLFVELVEHQWLSSLFHGQFHQYLIGYKNSKPCLCFKVQFLCACCLHRFSKFLVCVKKC